MVKEFFKYIENLVDNFEIILADLIMLGLATHEPYFTIVREEFNPHAQNFKPCELCGQYDHELKQCQGLPQNEVILFMERISSV